MVFFFLFSCGSPEVAHIFKGVGVVDGDGVAVHCCKVVPAMAEAALLARLHAELLDQPVPMLTLLQSHTSLAGVETVLVLEKHPLYAEVSDS